jgi:hypothetical protein
MRLQLSFFFSLMLTLGSGASAQEKAFSPGALPREGRSLADFTPRGWAVADRANGDLNADGIGDMAAILVQHSSGSDILEESQRVLLVLVSGAPGKFLLGGAHDGLLECVHCGGVKESVGLEIKKGVLIVRQLTGSREFTDQTWRFRYDPKSRRFVLIGKDVTHGDGMLGTGKKESFNLLTGLKISESYRYDQKRDREISLSSKKEKIPKQTPFLEDVRMEQGDIPAATAKP